MKSIAMIIASLSISVAGLVKGSVELIPFRVAESRSMALAKDEIGRSPDELKVTLSLTGLVVETTSRYGELKLDQAVDDLGTNLIPTKDPFHEATKFREFSNAFFLNMSVDAKRTVSTPQVEVRLDPAKRTATKMAHLRGSLSIAEAGKTKVIELDGLTGITKKTLDVPADAHMGMTVSVNANQHKEIRSLTVEITGDENALESIEVVDASGKKVSSGTSSWSISGGPIHKSLDLSSPATDSMKLVVKVAVDRKITRVPFDLKDIPLP